MTASANFPQLMQKIHLTRNHTSTVVLKESQAGCGAYICPKCRFKETFNEKRLMGHLRSHLKKHEMVECPFKNSQYRANVYSSFSTHKSRSHSKCDITDFKNDIVQTETHSQSIHCEAESNEGEPFQYTFAVGNSTCNSPDSQDDTGALQAQLRNNSFFTFENAQCSSCIRSGYTGHS